METADQTELESFGPCRTITELAEDLRCSERQIRQLIKQQGLPARKVGGLTRFGEKDLVKWWNSLPLVAPRQ